MNCKIIKGGDSAKIAIIDIMVNHCEISITDNGKPFYSCKCSDLEYAEYIANKNKCSKIYYYC